MKRITITMPDDTPFNTLAVLDLIEPGASSHTLITEHTDYTTTLRHSRLNVTIITRNTRRS